MPRPRSERRSPWPAVVLAVLLLLPVLYVASFGPAGAMYSRGQISERFIGLYRPVEWLATRNQTTVNWTFKYLNWWDRHWLGERTEAR